MVTNTGEEPETRRVVIERYEIINKCTLDHKVDAVTSLSRRLAMGN